MSLRRNTGTCVRNTQEVSPRTTASNIHRTVREFRTTIHFVEFPHARDSDAIRETDQFNSVLSTFQILWEREFHLLRRVPYVDFTIRSSHTLIARCVSHTSIVKPPRPWSTRCTPFPANIPRPTTTSLSPNAAYRAQTPLLCCNPRSRERKGTISI